MYEPTVHRLEIPPDFTRQLEGIQIEKTNNTGPSDDLEEEHKTWLIVGICIHTIISPMLRKYVDPIIKHLYNSLLSSKLYNSLVSSGPNDSIHNQEYRKYLKKYPANGFVLIYESINNNKWINDHKRYDYKVTSHVDLSKLFLQPSMAQYSAIDESCDSSALLGMVINISDFSAAVQTDAKEIRQVIRNPWAHIDFREWTATKYKESFRLMRKLVKDLNLSNTDESTILWKLNTWESNGQDFLSGTTLGLEVVADIRQQTHILSKYIQTLHTETDAQLTVIWGELARMEKKLQEQEQLSKKVDTHEVTLIEHTTILEKLEKDKDHIRAQHEQIISEWKEDSVSFVETRATHQIRESLFFNIYNCIVVTGSSGCGKSSNIHQAALHLNKEYAYEIIPLLTGPQDIIDFYNQKKNQVFVVDDVCGKETLIRQNLQVWRNLSIVLEQIFRFEENDSVKRNDGTGRTISGPKLLMSCRLHIYHEEDFISVNIFTRKMCNLLADELCLRKEDKICIAKMYIPHKIVEDVYQYMGDIDWFPLLCKLSKGKSFEEVKNLFTHPVESICKDIDKFIKDKQNNSHFCALVLCILFADGFNKDWLKLDSAPKDKKDKIESIVTEFDINLSRELRRNDLKTSFTTLDGTYLKGRGTEYRIIHDRIYEMACIICAKLLKECFIRFSSSAFIRDHFIFESLTENHTNDGFIVISKDQEEEYFERLQSDLFQFEITSTFNNTQLQYQSFMDKLISFFNRRKRAQEQLKFLDSRNCIKTVNNDLKKQKMLNSTPLLESAARGYLALVKYLIYGINSCVNKTDSEGRSPLYKASEGGHSKVVELFLKNKAEYLPNKKERPFENYTGNYVDDWSEDDWSEDDWSEDDWDVENNETPMHIACKEGHTDTVEVLLQYTDDVNDSSEYVESPLHVACTTGNRDIVQLLLQKGALVNQPDKNGCYPLHCASSKGHTDTVALLLENKAHVSSGFYESSVDAAFIGGHIETLKLLLENKDFSLRCYDATSRHWPCGNQYTELDRLFNVSSSFDFDLIIDRRLETEYRKHYNMYQKTGDNIERRRVKKIHEVPFPFGLELLMDKTITRFGIIPNELYQRFEVELEKYKLDKINAKCQKKLSLTRQCLEFLPRVMSVTLICLYLIDLRDLNISRLMSD